MKLFRLIEEDVWPLLNVLNEICHGIHIDDFEKCIGSKKEIVVELMDSIAKDENKGDVVLCLSDLEVNIVINSFKCVFKEIEEWEFQTRLGVSRQKAVHIEKKFMI